MFEKIAVLRHMGNDGLDAMARPHLYVLGRRCSAFRVCGISGLALAVGLGVLLTLHLDLSLWMLGVAVCIAVATFLALAMITKIIVGEERLIYYHHEVAILAMVALVLGLLGEPVLSYMDVTILGVGTFLFCGRIGCLMVGCCHGRPHRWGVCYRTEHAEAGFTPYFVGVRLFPIQLVESAWVFATVAFGVGMVFVGAAPGAALAWYVIVYDVGRFSFEFVRGDPFRPYRGGFSEGQWTSLLLILAVLGAELGGAIPLHVWHVAAGAGVILAMIGVAAHRRRRRDARHRLLSPGHVHEVAEAVALLTNLAFAPGSAPGPLDIRHHVNVARTSLGIRLSTGRVAAGEGDVRHFTLSSRDGTLEKADAHALFNLVVQLQRRHGRTEIHAAQAGAFHLLVYPPAARHNPPYAPTPSEPATP